MGLRERLAGKTLRNVFAPCGCARRIQRREARQTLSRRTALVDRDRSGAVAGNTHRCGCVPLVGQTFDSLGLPVRVQQHVHMKERALG